MAEVIRYVNPASTGGDGTTKALSGANAAYASLNAAINAEATDLVAAGNTMRIRCFGGQDTTQVVFPGAAWVTNAANPLIVEGDPVEADGAPPMDAWSTSHYRHEPTMTTADGTIDLQANANGGLDGLIFQDIQLGLVANQASGNSYIGWLDTDPWAPEQILWDRVFFRVTGNTSGQARIFVVFGHGDVPLKVRNCVGDASGFSGAGTTLVQQGVYNTGTLSTAYYSNCTWNGFDTVYSSTHASWTTISKNCLFTNCGTVGVGAGTVSGTGNVSDAANLGTMPSTGNVASATVTYNSGKFTLAPGDVGAIDQGIDLSADADLPVIYDAFGTDRTTGTYDAGYFEYSAGGASVTISDAGDEVYAVGDAVTIAGTNFEAAQGTGRVVISPSDDINDAGAVDQTVTSWSDTSIDITVVRGSLAFGTAMYLFVETDSAASNASGYAVQFVPIVTISEELQDTTGGLVASETGIKASVWRNREPTGAPDEELTGLSTDGSGILAATLAPGSLDTGDPVYLMLHKDDPVDWKATIVKLVPDYA